MINKIQVNFKLDLNMNVRNIKRGMCGSRLFLLAVIVVATPYKAIADQAAGDACAADLDEVGKKMYEAVANVIEPGDDVAKKMKEVIKPMVNSSDLSRSDVRANRKAVKDCVEKLSDE